MSLSHFYYSASAHECSARIWTWNGQIFWFFEKSEIRILSGLPSFKCCQYLTFKNTSYWQTNMWLPICKLSVASRDPLDSEDREWDGHISHSAMKKISAMDELHRQRAFDLHFWSGSNVLRGAYTENPNLSPWWIIFQKSVFNSKNSVGWISPL